MQHSIRDPGRDHVHGRIWRITHKTRPLVEPASAWLAEVLPRARLVPVERTGHLVQIDAPEGVFRRNEEGWEKLDVDSEIAAHRSRGLQAKEKSLPNILSLITKEQFELITTDPERPVIIQGSAGSGKTTVALHRLAWLLHENNSQVRADKTRVVVMNRSLAVYVSSTLPSMGIDEVQTTTFNSWALSVIRKAVKGQPFFKFLNIPSFVEEIKFSEEILQAIDGWVANQKSTLDAEINKQFSSREAHREAWAKSANKPLLPRLRDFNHDVKTSKLPEAEKQQKLGFIKKQISNLEDYLQDLYNLLSDTEHLRNYLPASPKLNSNLDYLKRLTEKMVFSGLAMACRLATCPTRISPSLVKATTEGVV